MEINSGGEGQQKKFLYVYWQLREVEVHSSVKEEN